MELKSIITDIGNSLDGLNSRLCQAKGRISELEGKSEKQKEKEEK